jgi:hypothetical protein
MREQQAPKAISLGGRNWTLRRKVPFGLMRAVAGADNGGDNGAVFDAFVGFLEGCIVRSERNAFREALSAIPDDDEDDEKVIDLGDVFRAAREVMEHCSGAPFGSPSVSLPGLPATGYPWQEPSSSEGSTSLPHRQIKL